MGEWPRGCTESPWMSMKKLFPEEESDIRLFAERYDRQMEGGLSKKEKIRQGRKWFERIIEQSITPEKWGEFLTQHKAGEISLDEFLLNQFREVFGKEVYEDMPQSSMLFHCENGTEASGTYFHSLNPREESESLWEQVKWQWDESEEQLDIDWDSLDEDDPGEILFEPVLERNTSTSGILATAYRGLIKALKNIPKTEFQNPGKDLVDTITGEIECKVFRVKDQHTTNTIMQNDQSMCAGDNLSYPVEFAETMPDGSVEGDIQYGNVLLPIYKYSSTIEKLTMADEPIEAPQVITLYTPVDSFMSESEKTEFIENWFEVKQRFEAVLN